MSSSTGTRTTAVGHAYNFVLVIRYKDGGDRMGEHKDDEKELDENVPIASLTFGAERDFVLRHEDKTRGVEKVDDGPGYW